jgi:hypothetical protein
MRRTFSLWWGSNDELRGERYPGLNGICDEALGFDAFHGFAGRLEFGFAFVSDRGQASGVSEREECQHHVRIERADGQLFGRPDVRPASELRRAANDDVRSSHCREHTAPRVIAGICLGSESLIRGACAWEPRRDRRAKLSGDHRMLQ